MAYEEEIEHTITGSTYEECREKLHNMYGKDYTIKKKVVDFRPGGFLHLGKKAVTIVTYVVNHQKSYSQESERQPYMDKYSEEEQFRRNRDAILQQTGNGQAVIINKVTK